MKMIEAAELLTDDGLDQKAAGLMKLNRRRKQMARIYSGIETKSLPEPVIYTDDDYAEEQIEMATNEDAYEEKDEKKVLVI